MMFQFLKRLLGFSNKDTPPSRKDGSVDRLRRACASDFVDHERSPPGTHRILPPLPEHPEFDRAEQERAAELKG
jgi:hypothetical protein